MSLRPHRLGGVHESVLLEYGYPPPLRMSAIFVIGNQSYRVVARDAQTGWVLADLIEEERSLPSD